MKDDLEIQQDVEAELRRELLIDSAKIGVSVSDGGVVTLTGTVPSFGQKYAAEAVPKRVYGVTAVADELTVDLPDRDRRTDSDIAAAAVKALKSSTLVPDEWIKATVDKGWVKLEGTVEYHYQRNAAEAAVRHLDGVKSLSNYIEIKPPVKVTPGAVKKEIYAAFHRNADLDARRVGIDVHDGKVVLHGNVHSFTERQEAIHAAWATVGVSEVEDRLTVTP
jgi:osmotically-inducible protein OsmY